MTDHASERDAALLAAIATGGFVHLTFWAATLPNLQAESPRWRTATRIEQGWLHLHDGRLVCCPIERRADCIEQTQRAADPLHDLKPREYTEMDYSRLIRIDLNVGSSGRYVPLWHHPEYAHCHHTLERERLACCPS
jgi:hypothetical protein